MVRGTTGGHGVSGRGERDHVVRGTTGGAWCQWPGREGPRGERGGHGVSGRGERDHVVRGTTGGMVSVVGERGTTW